MGETYDVYDGGQGEELPWELQPEGQAPTDAEDSGGAWCVIVEYANGGQKKPPTLVRVLDDSISTRERATELARERAYDFEPPDPLAPKAREVYADGDGFLTVIQGAMSTFHFNTRVVRFLGSA